MMNGVRSTEWQLQKRIYISNLTLVVLALIHACVKEIHVSELKYGLKSDIITRTTLYYDESPTFL